MTVRRVAGWAAAILASLMFLLAAVMKFTNNPAEVVGFTLFGLPIWFMYVSGAMELGGVALLLLSPWRYAGAALLVIVGLGATFEHLTHGQYVMAPIPFICAALAVLGAVLLQAQRRPMTVSSG
jgi:putative oxidoreductase